MIIGVAEGLIIGVGSGLTTTLIVGSWRLHARSRDRRKQMGFIRNLVASKFEQILSATDLPPPEPGEPPPSADNVRFGFIRELQSRLQVALSSRATELTYEEVAPLHEFLAALDRVFADIPQLRERFILPLPMARNFYDDLQSVSWLKLPEGDG